MFEKIIIIEWYDKIIRAFYEIDARLHYCSLVYEDHANDINIYVSIPLEFFIQSSRIHDIIKSDSIKENWQILESLIDKISKKNESFLIRTNDLQFGKVELIKFKSNFFWNKSILFAEYPNGLKGDGSDENWVEYFK